MRNLFLLFFISITFVQCVYDTMPEKDEACKTYVSILTTIDRGGTRTRAENYAETIESGSGLERQIGTIRVLIFDAKNEKLSYNYLFKPSVEFSSEEGEKKGVFKFSKTDFMGDASYVMNMKILSGYYRFVMIANERESWDLDNLDFASTTYESLKNGDNLKLNIQNTVMYDPDFEIGKKEETLRINNLIPMIGEQFFDIKSNAGNSQSNRLSLNPEVLLKRVLGKVEIYVTNMSGTNENINASDFYISSVQIGVKSDNKYSLFEDITTEAEWGGVSNFPDFLEEHPDLEKLKNTTSNWMISDNSVAYGANRFKRLYAIYCPEYLGAEQTKVLVTLQSKYSNDSFLYEVPIYKNTANGKDYNIYRNTIYRMYIHLKGEELKFVEIESIVGNWKSKETKSTYLHRDFNLVVEDNTKVKSGDEILLTITTTRDLSDINDFKVVLKPEGGVENRGDQNYSELIQGKSERFSFIVKDPAKKYLFSVYYMNQMITYAEINNNNKIVFSPILY